MDRESPLLEMIRNRRSIRRYRPDPVARDVIETLLTAAIWAPSAHNRQPWRFCVIESPEPRDAGAGDGRAPAQRSGSATASLPT